MNEVLDRIEQVLVASARRRTARRRRRAIVVVVAFGMLLLGSAASAVTGVGPLGDALTADEKLPRGAKPDPGGESVTLAGETADGHRQEVRVYRRKPDRRGRLRDLPGAYHYCAASYSADARGRLDPVAIHCTLGTALAIKLTKRRMWLQCSGRGGVVGEPAPPDPVCGLTLAGTRTVTIEPDGGSAGEVQLSRPFTLRVNRQPAIVRREGVDPRAAARLPSRLRVRAILGVVNAPPTQPGEHKPRVRVTATDAAGRETSARVGGQRLMTRADVPSFDTTPAPAGPRATLSTVGPLGQRWTAKGWGTRTGDHCVSSTTRSWSRNPSLFCIWAPELGRLRSIVRQGAQATTTFAHPPAPDGRRSYAVYGLVRADAAAVTVREENGRAWVAELSRPWATIRKLPGALEAIPPRFRPRFRGLPPSVRVRLFQAVLPGQPARNPRRRGTIETRLSGGRRLSFPLGPTLPSGPAPSHMLERRDP